MPKIPKTSVKTFLRLIGELNREMSHFAIVAAHQLNRIQELDFSSITVQSEKDEIEQSIRSANENFMKLIDMRDTLKDGLQRKVDGEIKMKTPGSKVKSLSTRRKSNSTTRKVTAHSI
jgi:hypothetical protein